MKQTLYVKYNSLRCPEFQVTTHIILQDGTKYVEKHPQTQEAVRHLKSIRDNYNHLSKLYKHIDVVPYSEPEANVLRFDFIQGTGLLDGMDFGKLSLDDMVSRIAPMIDRVLDANDDYLCDFEVTEDFIRMFPKTRPKAHIPALTVCNLDSILSNFIRVGDTIKCIDYEWVIRFPIPIDYLKYRILLYLYTENVSLLADRYALDTFMTAFGLSKGDIAVYASMEDEFQCHVHGDNRQYLYTLRYMKAATPLPTLNQTIDAQQNHINNLEHIIDTLKHDIVLKDQEIANRLEINRVQSKQLDQYSKALHHPSYAAFAVAKKAGKKAKQLSVSSRIGRKVYPDYEDKYRELITEKDQDYETWIGAKESHYPRGESFAYRPKISVLVPVYNVEDRHLVPCIESVIGQSYDNWELCLADDHSSWENVRATLKRYEDHPKIKIVYRETNGHISAATNSALDLATGEYVGLLDCDDLLTENALYEMVKKLNEDRNLEFMYSDEDKVDDDGNHRHMPHFKPDWSPDTLMSHMYTCHFTVYKTERVREVGGLRTAFNGSQDYDLALRVADAITPDRIAHIDKVLYHWREREESTSGNAVVKPYVFDAARRAKLDSLRRRGLTGRVEFVEGIYQYQVRYDVKGTPLVSVIIPSKDNYEILKTCLESIDDKTTYRHYEIIIVDNGSAPEAKAQYEQLADWYGARYIYDKQDFNYSKMNNIGIRAAKGDYLLLLNDDIEIVDGDWMEVMLGQAQLDYTGAVGCKLLYPESGNIQHVGVINIENGPIHPFAGSTDDVVYYFGRNKMSYNVLAVTAACLMIKKSKYEEVGGLDESFAVAYNDVDFCMKLTEAGYYNVVRNDVKNYHHESVSRGDDLIDIDKLRRLMNEEERLYKNHPSFSHADPFYNSNLTSVSDDFSCNLADYKLKLSAVAEKDVKEKITKRYVGVLDSCTVHRYIYIEGYLFRDYIKDNNAIDYKIVLKNDKHTYIIDTYKEYRPDVANTFNHVPRIDFCGFRCRFHRDKIVDGTYKIYLLADKLFDLERHLEK